MKKLLSMLLLFVTFGAVAQTYDTLPTGSKPYGNFYLGPDGNLVFGNAGLKFRVIGTKKRVDSLLALKADLSQLALYQTKALLQQDLTPTASGYPSVNAVIGGLNMKANSGDLASYQAKSEKGQSNGYAGLDGSGKVPLTQINDALLGAVNYRGTYNAATNSPTLPAAASSNKGYYYIVSTAGTQFGLTFRVGDWIISNGSAYGKVASSSDVESVNGKKGVVNVDLNDVLTAGNSSEQAMGVGALIAGSASVTSAPTQPSHVVRLEDISAGKTIGASTTGNAATATTATNWGNAFSNNIVFNGSRVNAANPSAIGFLQDNIFKFGLADDAKTFLGLNNYVQSDGADFAGFGGNNVVAPYLRHKTSGTVVYLAKTDGSNINAGLFKTALGTSLRDAISVGNNINTLQQISFVTGSNDYGIGTPNGSGTQIFAGANDDVRIGNMTSNSFTDRIIVKGSGNVGIGTTNPTNDLEVGNGANDSGITIVATSGATPASIPTKGLQLHTGYGVSYIQSYNAVNSLTDLYIDNLNTIFNTQKLTVNGNVGVGTTSPTQKLEVAGNIKSTGGFAQTIIEGSNRADLSLTNTGAPLNAKNLLLSNENGVTRFWSLNDAANAIVQNNIISLNHTTGNVGIGTGTANAKLEVNGSARILENDGSSTAAARNIDLQNKANLSGGNSFTGNGVQNFIGTGDQRSTIQPGIFSNTNTGSTAYSALGLYNLTFSAGSFQTSYQNGFITSNITGSNKSFDLPTVSGRLLTGVKTLVTLDFPNVAANQNAVLTQTVADVGVNDVVTLALPNSIMSTMTNWNGNFKAWISGANTVSFMFQNLDPSAAHDLPNTTFGIFIHKQ